MRRLSLIRLAILIVMRDFLIPGGGLFLAVYLVVTEGMSPWHLPLIAGMLGTPLVARGGGLEAPPEGNPPPAGPMAEIDTPLGKVTLTRQQPPPALPPPADPQPPTPEEKNL